MPVLFLDSSALVKRYVGETGSLWVQRQTDATSQNSLYVVRLTGVEVVSAIARKARAGGTAVYSPANPAHWNATPPATIAEALDRLAAAVSNNGANPIP